MEQIALVSESNGGQWLGVVITCMRKVSVLQLQRDPYFHQPTVYPTSIFEMPRNISPSRIIDVVPIVVTSQSIPTT